MNEKTKKILTLVFSAVISLAVSIAAIITGLPASEFIPESAAAANGETEIVSYYNEISAFAGIGARITSYTAD